MSRSFQSASLLIATALCCACSDAAETPSFAKLTPLPAPQITAAAEAYPGGNYTAEKLLDGDIKSAYATNGKGIGTFVEFDFGKPLEIAAFQHIDRIDPATVAASELQFTDGDGKPLATLTRAACERVGRHVVFCIS